MRLYISYGLILYQNQFKSMSLSFTYRHLAILCIISSLCACQNYTYVRHRYHGSHARASNMTINPINKDCNKPYYTWIPLILSVGALSAGLIGHYGARTCLQVNQSGDCLKDRAAHTISLDLTVLGALGTVISYSHHRYAWQKNCLYKNINQYNKNRSLFLE